MEPCTENAEYLIYSFKNFSSSCTFHYFKNYCKEIRTVYEGVCVCEGNYNEGSRNISTRKKGYCFKLLVVQKVADSVNDLAGRYLNKTVNIL